MYGKQVNHASCDDDNDKAKGKDKGLIFWLKSCAALFGYQYMETRPTPLPVTHIGLSSDIWTQLLWACDTVSE